METKTDPGSTAMAGQLDGADAPRTPAASVATGSPSTRVEDAGDPYHTALIALPEGVIYQDQQGRVVASNPAAQRILGLTQDQLLDRTALDPRWQAVQEDGSPFPGAAHPAMVALRTGQPQRDVIMGMLKPDGLTTWILMQAEPVFTPGATAPQAVVCSFADITHARHARQALELAKQEAEDSGRIKDKFVSLLAHDLRAPIAAAMSMVQMVSSDSEPPLSGQQRETLQAVNVRLQQQLTLIDEVLSMTRLRTGKLRVHKRPVSAGVLLAAVMGFRFQAEQKGVRLVNEVPDSLQLAADPVLFGQVIQNLVSNAIKFSQPGGIVRLFAPPGHAATLAVQDGGVGIDPKRVPDLFRSDVKTSTVGTAGERGTGMGLPLSHDIVVAHGGTLRVESEPGRGSTFYVDMPPYRPVVMVVDDETDLRTLFTRYLARMGCEVIESSNGEEALKLLQTTYPSLIITDIQMPKLDGFGLLDAVRRNPETAEIPVIVVTVGTDVEIRDKAFGLGANDFVTKPITPHDFVPRVRRFLT